MPGDSDLIVLGYGLGIRTFKSSPGNCDCVRVDLVRAARVRKHRVAWEGKGGALNPVWAVSEGD